jgi:hypothetical protein
VRNTEELRSDAYHSELSSELPFRPDHSYVSPALEPRGIKSESATKFVPVHLGGFGCPGSSEQPRPTVNETGSTGSDESEGVTILCGPLSAPNDTGPLGRGEQSWESNTEGWIKLVDVACDALREDELYVMLPVGFCP